MDEGAPIAYAVLAEGVAVYSSDGVQVGMVEHVVAAPALDIFHGIVMSVAGGSRFVEAVAVASLHERGVDLRIDAAQAQELPTPEGAAPAWTVRDPGVKPSRWHHVLDELKGIAPGRRDWKRDE